MIEVDSIFFRYHQDWVLQDVSFQLRKGEFVGVIGPNGSGKTTLLKILYRLLSPQQGEVFFDRLSLKKMSRREIAKKAMECTETLPISQRPIDELSGGERKRVYIARALAQEPEMILLDEPTSNLDIHHQVEFLDLVLSLNREKGLTILMASHDLNLASEYCDRLIFLQNGKIYKMGSPEEVMTRENIEKVYGCEVWVDRNPVSGMPRVSLLRKGVH